MANAENVAPQVWRGVARELRRLAAAPPAGVKLLLSEHDLSDVQALVDGPADTPYAGGVFRVRLALGRDFPAAPPRAYFLTRIFHPNVSAAGEVCVNTLKKDWRPELGLEHALLAVKCLLIAPNAESALNAEAAALLRDDYRAYCARAALYTDIHARGAAVGVGAGPSLPADPSPAEPALPAPPAPAARVADDGPRAKRRAGGAGAAPAPARDRRRILKRL